MKILALVVTGSMEAASIAHGAAGFIDGNELLSRCKSESRDQQHFCAGYINGILDLRQAQRWVNGEKAIDVVTRYLDDNPGERQIPAAISVDTAIENAWCPNSRGSLGLVK